MSALHPQLQPYAPTATDPFDAIKAAHLLNRAGFGGTPAEISKVMKLGPAAAIDWLLDFPDASAQQQDPTDLPGMDSLKDMPGNFREMSAMYAGKSPQERMALQQKMQMANRLALITTGQWWMNRMASAARPLQEKLTLFWHGHFTTSGKDERATKLMWAQNETLRQHAAGNFGKFVKAISRDPAMLDYLNNQQNRRSHPNENFARELMELFTLGIGQYTEDDIKNGARAFTGWGHNGSDFLFRRFDHDTETKTFLGKKGNFDGDDIIDIILQQPACPRYIAGRLYDFFVSETENQPIANSLGDLLRENNYELRPVLRTLFTSRNFYSPQIIGAQIKSPVQLLVGLCRAIQVPLPPARMMFQPNGPLMQMGQAPFFPPNVKGWPGGRAWINTSTMFVRYNSCARIAGDAEPKPASSADLAVAEWTERLIQRPIDAPQRQTLLDAVGPKPTADSIRRMIQLIVSMPEYQLC
jgi:uncharacterized protein (DUF1800 family)